jgi:site-specific recombinase XerD
LREAQLKALLDTCEKMDTFENRRDAAILRVFIDTGARRAEIANLRYDAKDDAYNDIDLNNGIIRVLGKGRRERVLPIGNKTVKALDRYLRRRATRTHAASEWLWIGNKGRFTQDGVAQMIQRRGEIAASAASTRTSCVTPSPINGLPAAAPKGI